MRKFVRLHIDQFGPLLVGSNYEAFSHDVIGEVVGVWQKFDCLVIKLDDKIFKPVYEFLEITADRAYLFPRNIRHDDNELVGLYGDSIMFVGEQFNGRLFTYLSELELILLNT